MKDLRDLKDSEINFDDTLESPRRSSSRLLLTKRLGLSSVGHGTALDHPLFQSRHLQIRVHQVTRREADLQGLVTCCRSPPLSLPLSRSLSPSFSEEALRQIVVPLDSRGFQVRQPPVPVQSSVDESLLGGATISFSDEALCAIVAALDGLLGAKITPCFSPVFCR